RGLDRRSRRRGRRLRVQLKHARILTAVVAASSLGAGAASAQLAGGGQSIEALTQFFNDSHHVSVRSAIGDYSIDLKDRAELKLHWNNERVVVPAIAAPPGTQEAVDAITTASRPISGNAYSDFVKVRNEVQGTLQRGHAEVNAYLSTESDYTGHQVGASVNHDFRDDQLNVSFGTSYGWDDIQPAADDDTRSGPAHKRTLHLNTVATQVLSPTTLLRMGVEYNHVEGLQHNPYRNVFA